MINPKNQENAYFLPRRQVLRGAIAAARAGGLLFEFEYSKYNGWPEINSYLGSDHGRYSFK